MKLRLKLHTQIFIGLFLGLILGLFWPGFSVHLKPFGLVFIRLLYMITVPLIVTAMVKGISTIGNIKRLSKLGSKALIYYLITTVMAIFIGLICVALIRPGVNSQLTLNPMDLLNRPIPPSVGELFINIIPDNIFAALGSNQMVSVIFFSILLGVALSVVGDRGKEAIRFFDALNQAVMVITQWVMALAPFGVFALMASIVSELGLAAFKPLFFYMITILIGLAVHAVIVLPIIVQFLGRYSPIVLFRKMITALSTVFSTANSSATMPVTMESLVKRVGVVPRIVDFMIPIGTMINLNGTALYQAVAVVFIAQVYGIELGFSQYMMIAAATTFAAFGTSGIPSAGLITMAIILTAVNIPVEGIALILPVDRLLDMCRSSVNLWSNACGVMVVNYSESEVLTPIEQLEEKRKDKDDSEEGLS